MGAPRTSFEHPVSLEGVREILLKKYSFKKRLNFEREREDIGQGGLKKIGGT